MKLIGSVILILVLAIIQLSAQEMQVPISEEHQIMTLTPEQRNNLKLFPEISGFQDAKLFQSPDSSYVLEITYKQQEHIIKKRTMMTLSDIQSLRSRIDEMFKQATPLSMLDQTGRSTLLNTMIGLSVGYYGWSVPFLVQDKLDDKVVVGLYLFSAGGIILCATLVTQGKEVSKESAVGFEYGAFRGIVHGSALCSIIAGEIDRWFIPISSVLSILEGSMVMSSVRANHTPLGNIYTVGVVTDFGIGIGAGGAFLLRKGDALTLAEKDLRLLGSMVLLGSGMGYVIGRTMVSNTSYSSGDADILQMTGVLGATSAYSIADLLGMKSRKDLVATTMAGAAIGLGIGHALTCNTDFTDGQGTSIRLYSSLGTIMGLGTAYVIFGTGSKGAVYFSLSTLGAAIGFSLAYSSANSEQSSSSSTHGWNIKLDPFGMNQKFLAGRGKEITRYTPAMKLEYRF